MKRQKYKLVQIKYSEDYTSCKIYIDKKKYYIPSGTRKRFDSKYGFIIMVPYNKRINIDLVYSEFNKWVNNIIWKGRFCKYERNNLIEALFFAPKHGKQFKEYNELLLNHVNAKLSLFDTWYNDKKIDITNNSEYILPMSLDIN